MSQVTIFEQEAVKFSRYWEMPNSNTFDLACIVRFINRHNPVECVSVDPFANKNRIAKLCNDIDPAFGTEYVMDALEFMRSLEDNSVDLLLFDPPYSPRQLAEVYKKVGKSVNMQTTQMSYWSNLKQEAGRIVKRGGVTLCFGWNSGGIGRKYGFELIEIMLVAHGSQHNDTICTAERKIL